jgi:hypothetical protein
MTFSRPSFVANAGIVVFSLLLSGCGSSTASFAPSRPVADSGADASASLRAWNRKMTAVPFPGTGCFDASYPAPVWTRVACGASGDRPPSITPPPRIASNATSPYIGSGYDYVIQVPRMSGAIGSFPASNTKSVKSCKVGDNACVKSYGNNSFDLQLNTSFFTASSTACSEAGRKLCIGWQQFDLTNFPQQYKGHAYLGIEDWLYSTTDGVAIKCPSTGGWYHSGSSKCTTESQHRLVPNVPITELNEVMDEALASPSGDSIILTIGGHKYAISNAQPDFLDLREHFNQAEFNIFGAENDRRAFLNPGSTVTVNLQAMTGSKTAPTCIPPSKDAGTTGETNNLSFVAPSPNPQMQMNPSIYFTESNGSTSSARCVRLAAQ